MSGLHKSPMTELAVLGWSAWAPGLTTPEEWLAWSRGEKTINGAATPTPAFVEPMLRRRLSPLSKLMLTVAHDSLHGRTPAASIWANRHGELQITSQLLQQLAADEPLSPMGFSLSVHNTAAGLYGIATKLQAPSTAIAAGDQSLSAGFLEAYAQLAAGSADVLLVYAEEAPPALFAWTGTGEAAYFGLAVHLSGSDSGQGGLRLQHERKSVIAGSDGLSLVRALLGASCERWSCRP